MRFLNQRGDTLIEVTLALAILAAVLTGAFAAASGAFRLGQTAKERSELISAAQRQAEALTNFRDSHTWNEFLNGGGVGPGSYNGIHVGLGVSCSLSGTDCFHMERKQLNGVWQWVPMPGSLGSGADPTIPATGAIGIKQVIVSPTMYKFHIYHGNDVIGNATLRNSGEVVIELGNLDALR